MNFGNIFKDDKTIKVKYPGKGKVYFIFKPLGARRFFELQKESVKQDASGKTVPDELVFSLDLAYESLVGWEGIKVGKKVIEFNEENKATLFDSNKKLTMWIMEQSAKIVKAESDALETDSKN